MTLGVSVEQPLKTMELEDLGTLFKLLDCQIKELSASNLEDDQSEAFVDHTIMISFGQLN